jgi:hypothetical protein
MKKFKVLQIAIVLVSVVLSAILFTSCQKEPSPVEQDLSSNQLGKFNLPAGATFVSATFNVKINVATSQQIDVHRITSPWEEMVVTWNNFGGYAPEIVNSFTPCAVGWTSVDITSLVGGWLNGTYPNYGLLLDQVNQTWPRTEYDTREYEFAVNASYLEICYTLNGGSVCDTTRNIGDTYIYQLNPDENNGFKGEMYTGWGYYNDLEKQALVQFDLGYTPPPQEVCETAYAYGGSIATCFLDISPRSANNWGWTNLISPGYIGEWPLYAGAGQCDISKGTLVGHVDVSYVGGTITIDYVLDTGFNLDEKHVWIGTTLLPIKSGIYQNAPGKFNYNNMDPVVLTGQTGNKYVAVHSGVCWEVQ